MNPIFPQRGFNSLYRSIVRGIRERESRSYCKRACYSADAVRRRHDIFPDSVNIRAAFAHDADRIIHCKAYSRYIDKTQVFFLVENDHITHRVLHVQFVAKIARTICRALGLNEDLAEAIALAHDLGHAPFGHAGETFLADILQECKAGTFVHNAQSVRVLDRLEAGGAGLNLTLQVLDGVLGHNGELLSQEVKPYSSPSWETLDSACSNCLTIPRFDRRVYPSTFEGCVVRIADVISYIGRDIEDAVELGMISREEVPGSAGEVLGFSNREIINNLVMDIIQQSANREAIQMSPEVYTALDCLRKFNYERIYLAPPIEEEKRRLKDIFKRLFEAYLADMTRGDETSDFVQYLRNMDPTYQAETSPERAVADFVAGMTDDYLLRQFTSRFMPRGMGYRYEDGTGSRLGNGGGKGPRKEDR